MEKGLLDNKRVLMVDDEPDVLATLRDLLPMCEVTEATTFEQAKELLEMQVFDIAIPDISPEHTIRSLSPLLSLPSEEGD
jgi:response regulator RpfG family c-di-GMP phosphodiesterase